MFIRSSILLVFLIILFAAFGCTQYKQEAKKENSLKAPLSDKGSSANKEGQAVGIKLEGSRKMNGKKLASSFSFSAETEFEGTISVVNEDSVNDHHLITLLLDYKQSVMTIENKAKIAHTFTVDSYFEKSISFKTKKLSKGFHDLTILVFSKPDNLPLNTNARLVNNPPLNYMRSNLFVDSTKIPPIKHTIKATGPAKDKDVPELILSKNRNLSLKSAEGTWVNETVKPGEQLNYFIHLQHSSNTTAEKTFAVIPFLDYKQISINKNEKKPQKFAKLKYNEKTLIPASLVAPQKKGVHELQVVAITSPYKKLSDDENTRMSEDSEEQISHSFRVAVIVE